MTKKGWATLSSILFVIALIEFAIILYDNSPSRQIKIIKVTETKNTEKTPATSNIIDVGVPNTIHDDISTSQVEESGAKVRTGKYANWYRLKMGMAKTEVKSILGKPRYIKKGISEIWRYSYTKDNFGDVIFYKNKVITWLPPTISLEEVE